MICSGVLCFPAMSTLPWSHRLLTASGLLLAVWLRDLLGGFSDEACLGDVLGSGSALRFWVGELAASCQGSLESEREISLALQVGFDT